MRNDFEDASDGKSSDEKTSRVDDKKTFTYCDRVGVRLPPFWPEKPALWFAQIEANFILSGIKDEETKFLHVISQLEHRYAAEVEDLICSPPSKDRYKKLKEELIKRLSASREKEVKQLLMHEELGDRRPSQFLRHLQHLAGPGVPDDFLKTIWISRLPVHLQTVVAAGKTYSLEELADLADRVHDVVPNTSNVAAASTSSPTSTIDKMAADIAALTRQVRSLTSYGNRRSRSKQRNGSYRHTHSNSKSQSRSQSSYRKFPICFFHYKHGENARKCLKPCDYKGNANGGR